MELLHSFLSEQMIERIGWVLIHLLWQGCAIAALTWCALKALSKSNPNIRYIASCIALVLTAAAPIVTFTLTDSSTNTVISIAATESTAAPAINTVPEQASQITIAPIEPPTIPEKSWTQSVTAQFEAALPYCVIGWFLGVTTLSVWYLGGWYQLQKLRRIGTKTVTDAVSQTTCELADRLGITKAIHIAESALVQVPTVIGWLKPVILLPVSALTGLDPTQLKAMITHELAHIKRCDYLVNIAQTIVEILGFYHPGVWWISRQIRIERENCCDDIAVALLQNRKEYAGALFTMEAIRHRQYELAVAANGGNLEKRISRLAQKNPRHEKSGWIPSAVTMLLVIALLSGLFIFQTASAQKDRIKAPTKQQVTDLIEQVRLALQSKDPVQIDNCIYFENQDLRQKALQLIMQETEQFPMLESSHILEITSMPDQTWQVFGLFSPDNRIYFSNSRTVVYQDNRYKLNLVTQETLDRLESARTSAPEEIGKSYLTKEIDLWKITNDQELEKLIQAKIQDLERSLIVREYANENNLRLPAIDTVKQVNESLTRFKNTPPEQLRLEIINELTQILNDLETNKSRRTKTSKASKKAVGLEDIIPGPDENQPIQILTKSYVVSIPADFPKLEMILSKDNSQANIIPPETLDEFMNSLKSSPDAKIITFPSILTNDGQAGQVATTSNPKSESIKLSITNHVIPGKNSLRAQVEFEYTVPIDQGPDLQSVSSGTMVVIPSGHAVAIGNHQLDNRLIFVLIKTEIQQNRSSKTGVIQPASDKDIKQFPTGMGELPGGLGKLSKDLVDQTDKNENNIQALPLNTFEAGLIKQVLNLVEMTEKKHPEQATHWPAGPSLYHVDRYGHITVWSYQELWHRNKDCGDNEVGMGSSQVSWAQGMYYLPDGTPLKSRWSERNKKANGMKDIRVNVGRPVSENERTGVIHRYRLSPHHELFSQDGLEKSIRLQYWENRPLDIVVRVDKPMRLTGWNLGALETDIQHFDKYDQLIINGLPRSDTAALLVTVEFQN